MATVNRRIDEAESARRNEFRKHAQACCSPDEAEAEIRSKPLKMKELREMLVQATRRIVALEAEVERLARRN